MLSNLEAMVFLLRYQIEAKTIRLFVSRSEALNQLRYERVERFLILFLIYPGLI